ITRAITDPANPQFGAGFNRGAAGGGLWAAWLAPGSVQSGLFTSEGLHLPAADLLAVGPGGELGYKPAYQSLGPMVCRERDGSEWTIDPAAGGDLQLLGGRRAIWQYGQQLRVVGLPPPQQIGAAYWPRAHEIAGRWWVSYWSTEAG